MNALAVIVAVAPVLGCVITSPIFAVMAAGIGFSTVEVGYTNTSLPFNFKLPDPIVNVGDSNITGTTIASATFSVTIALPVLPF